MLLDIDKNNDDRGTPMPNTHDKLPPATVMARGTNSVNYVTTGTNQSLVTAGKNGQFTIVQTGSYATTTTLSTSNPGTGNFIGESQDFYQVPHNLPYIPAIMAYEITSDGFYSLMPWSKYANQTGALANWFTWIAYVDATYVTLTLKTMTYGNATWNYLPGFSFKWYLLYQTSN